MGQIIGGAAKPKRCNLNKLSQLGTPAAGEYILVSSDNSMNAVGQGNFDCYIMGDGQKAATALELRNIMPLGVFDLSAYTGSTYVDLAAALNAMNTLSTAYKKGGMSVKFVQSSDNKYVQFRCMTQSFTTDVTQWQGVDDEPTAGSKNLIESNAVYKMGTYGEESYFNFELGSINYITGEDVNTAIAFRSSTINIDKSLNLSIYLYNASANDVYVLKYLDSAYIGYDIYQNLSEIYINYDGTFNKIRLRVNLISSSTIYNAYLSCYTIPDKLTNFVKNIDDRLVNFGKNTNIKSDLNFVVGIIDTNSGQEVTSNLGIITNKIYIIDDVFITLSITERTKNKVVIVTKYLGDNYVGHLLYHDSSFIVEKDNSFDFIRISLKDGDTWTSTEAENSRGTLIQSKGKTDIVCNGIVNEINTNKLNTHFAFEYGIISTTTGENINSSYLQGLRSDFIDARIGILFLSLCIPQEITVNDIYIFEYLDNNYVGYFHPQNVSEIPIEYDGNFNKIRIRVGSLSKKIEEFYKIISSYSYSYSVKEQVQILDEQVEKSNDILYKCDSVTYNNWEVGRIDYNNGGNMNDSYGIRTAQISIDKDTDIELSLPQRANPMIIFVFKYLNNSYVGYNITTNTEFTISKTEEFNIIRLMVVDSVVGTWSATEASNATTKLCIKDLEDVLNNPILKYSQVETIDALVDSTISGIFMGQSVWSKRQYGCIFVKTVEEGDIITIKANDFKESYIGFTDNFIPPLTGKNTEISRIIIPQGTSQSFIVPKGMSTLIIDGVLDLSNDYTPTSATITRYNIKKYDYKAENSNFQAVEGASISFLNSQIVNTKAIKIANQEMVPTDGVYLSFYNGNLILTINGVKHNIQYI